MTKMNTGSGRPVGPRPENDVYTALTCVAFLFVLSATLYVGYRSMALFGSLLPAGGN